MGDITTAVYDSNATLHSVRTCNPFRRTRRKSKKVFNINIPNSTNIAATEGSRTEPGGREVVKTVHIVPELKHNSLLSVSKFADAGYISILTLTNLIIINDDGVVQKKERMPSSESKSGAAVHADYGVYRRKTDRPSRQSTSSWQEKGGDGCHPM